MTKKNSVLAAVFFTAFSLTTNAQVDEKGFYIGPGGSYHLFPLASLNAQIRDFGFSKGFGNAMGVGIDYASYAAKNKVHLSSLYSFHWLLSQTISAKDTSGNSYSMKMQGYHAQFDLFSFDFVASDQVCFVTGLAYCFGRLKVTETSPSGSTVFTNPYFAPEIRSELSFKMGDHFFAGLRSAYRDDISKSGWKQTGIHAADLAGTRLSGWSFGAFIGYGK